MNLNDCAIALFNELRNIVVHHHECPFHFSFTRSKLIRWEIFNEQQLCVYVYVTFPEDDLISSKKENSIRMLCCADILQHIQNVCTDHEM